MTAAWKGACQLAASAVREKVKKLDREAKGGLLVDPEQRKALGLLADWIAAAQHHGPEVLSGLAIQGTLTDYRAHVEAERRPVGFRPESAGGGAQRSGQ